MKIKDGDTPHEIVSDIELKNNAQLHRFNNHAGIPYSAIYVDGKEIWSCRRVTEAEMIKDWNEYIIL